MTEPIKPQDQALSERTAKRDKLWDRSMTLAQMFAGDLRGPLQEDPWDHGKSYTEAEIAEWREKAVKASEMMEQLFNDIDEILTQPCPEERKKAAEARRAARVAAAKSATAKPPEDDGPPF